MKQYIQLKDGIAFSNIFTENELETSDSLIEVSSDVDANSLLKKKYNNGSWEEPESIYFISSYNQDDSIDKIESTIFPSEVFGEIVDPTVRPFWIKNQDGVWVEPPAPVVEVAPAPSALSDEWIDEAIQFRIETEVNRRLLEGQ